MPPRGLLLGVSSGFQAAPSKPTAWRRPRSRRLLQVQGPQLYLVYNAEFAKLLVCLLSLSLINPERLRLLASSETFRQLAPDCYWARFGVNLKFTVAAAHQCAMHTVSLPSRFTLSQENGETWGKPEKTW